MLKASRRVNRVPRRASRSSPILGIVLSGRFSIRLERGGIARVVKEWKTRRSQRIPALLAHVDRAGRRDRRRALEVLRIPNADIKDMTRDCYEFTALCVHEMLDRARQFKSEDLLVQKLASLGVLVGGDRARTEQSVVRGCAQREGARRGACGGGRRRRGRSARACLSDRADRRDRRARQVRGYVRRGSAFAARSGRSRRCHRGLAERARRRHGACRAAGARRP